MKKNIKYSFAEVLCLILAWAVGAQAAELHTIDFAFGTTDGATMYENGDTLSIPTGKFDLGVYVRSTSGTITVISVEVLAGWSKTSTRGDSAASSGTEITNQLTTGFNNYPTDGWNAPTRNKMGGGKGADNSMGSYGSHLAMGRTPGAGDYILKESWFKLGELHLTNNMTLEGSQYTMKLWRADTPQTGGWSCYVSNTSNKYNELTPTTLIIETAAAPEPISLMLMSLGGWVLARKKR